MEPTLINRNQPLEKVKPLCPVFGECGGCLYQDISYPEELRIKEKQLKDLMIEALNLADNVFESIIASPKSYHYRNRLDLKLKRIKSNDIFIGFTPVKGKGVVAVDACYIAEQKISNYIPELKRQAIELLPNKYKVANLTVRTSSNGKVLWGGIGRRSCQLPEKDYFWLDINGKRIFYSLDTFFQANLSILPLLFEVINGFPFWNSNPTLYDLYGGVGLFGIGLIDQAKKVVLIEESIPSLKVARYNVDYNQCEHIEIIEGRIEDKLPGFLTSDAGGNNVAMIDPPRAGLSEQACRLLAGVCGLQYMMYLSCHTESLTRDLKLLTGQRWDIQTVIPFDFFPKTKHLETLVLLKSKGDHCELSRNSL